jgi:hypothetical protein
MRTAPGKELGYVLVPVYAELAEGETHEEAIRRANFTTVFEVLQSLRERDEVLNEELRELAIRKTVIGPDDARYNSRLEVTVIAPEVLIEDLRETVEVHCADNVLWDWERQWNENYAATLRYKEQTGNPNVLATDDPVVGAWQAYQRRLYDQGGYSPTYIKLLEQIEGWEWNRDRARWDSALQQIDQALRAGAALNQYQRRWLENQAHDLKSGDLPLRRIAPLKELGYIKEAPDGTLLWRDYAEELWHQRFKEYRDHVLTVGSEVGLSQQLRTWLAVQRGRKRGTRRLAPLSPEQIALLESVPGFSWNPTERNCCLRGHPYTPENSYLTKQGGRYCRVCARERNAAKPRKERKVNTHCRRGHPYSPENTYIDPKTGHRRCNECHRLFMQRAGNKYRKPKSAAVIT